MSTEEMWTNDGPAIYLNADKTEVAEEGSEDAAYLLVAEGGQIPMEQAEQYGLTESENAPAKGAALIRRRRDAQATEERGGGDADMARRLDAERARIEDEDLQKAKKDQPDNKRRG
ncbi:MAG TPA: hypothetical protein VNM70_10870 [Burkholderiales bacterium]|nr:hypothetical protein [Burkholderiales bacterium]